MLLCLGSVTDLRLGADWDPTYIRIVTYEIYPFFSN